MGRSKRKQGGNSNQKTLYTYEIVKQQNQSITKRKVLKGIPMVVKIILLDGWYASLACWSPTVLLHSPLF